MTTKLTHKSIFVLLLAFTFSVIIAKPSYAHPDGLLFPVVGNTNYSDTFLAYRAGQVDNKHHAIDIFGAKHSSLVSPVNGTVRYVGYPQDSWGWYIVIVDDDGFEYHFMHINNDNIGTDDGGGGPTLAYAPDMKEGNRVARGQHIAYMGDSGNAETTPAHLHFEIIKPEYTSYNYRDIPLVGFVNPFTFLNAAAHIGAPVEYPALPGEVLPYGPKAAMNISVARGNLNTDPESETVTGAGPGGGPHVKVFKSDGTFTGREFMAYSPYFYGGIDVATGDIDGDGKAEIITGIQSNGGPHVRVFNKDGSVVGEYFAYVPQFTGGIDVATGDVNGDGKAEIITGAGVGGGPHVRITNSQGVDLSNGGFYAYDYRFAGGVKVSVGEVNTNNSGMEIAVVPWSGGGPNVRTFSAQGRLLGDRNYLEVWWSGYYDVAAGGKVYVGTGVGRRTSIRVLN